MGGALISWVVASHDPAVLAANLQPALDAAAALGDEVIVVRDAPSIAAAYNLGSGEAAHRVRCYVHHDVRVLDVEALRSALLETCTADVGMVGVIGSRTPALPWWEGDRCGSAVDSRLGRLNFSGGGEPCAVLDGLLLATANPVLWDERYAAAGCAWHLYDHDACAEARAVGLTNWCLPGGADLVEHHTTNSTSTAALSGWAYGLAVFRAKWGL